MILFAMWYESQTAATHATDNDVNDNYFFHVQKLIMQMEIKGWQSPSPGGVDQEATVFMYIFSI